MKSLRKPIYLLACGAALLLAAPGQAQTVTMAVLHLHTNDDDRPKDSVLEISILTNRGELVMKGAAPNEAWQPNSDHDIAIQVPANLGKDKLAKTFALLHFQPKGRDALKYNLRLEVSFSDGSKLVGALDKLFLDQDHRDFACALYLP